MELLFSFLGLLFKELIGFGIKELKKWLANRKKERKP
jgi:hypothetical protein